MYVYVCMYLYMYVYVCICICMHMYVYVFESVGVDDVIVIKPIHLDLAKHFEKCDVTPTPHQKFVVTPKEVNIDLLNEPNS